MSINISNDLLIKLAGKPAFARGQSVYENQQIESWKRQKNSIHAMVQGTELYRVKLTITNKMLDGICSCPASENFDFCKHCVAVALAYSAHELEIDSKSKGSSPDRIEAYLMQQSKQDLLKHLLGLIEQNPQLEKQWLLKADLSHNLVDAKMLRKKITQAIPYRSLWGYRQVGAYFSNAEAAIDLLIVPVAKQSADDQVKLIMYAYQRLNKALERIDDSGGYRYGMEQTLADALNSAYALLDWPNQKKAAFLCDQLEQSYDVFPSIPEDFIDEDDDELMREFIKQCELRWNALFGNANQAQREELSHNGFSSVLLEQAEKAGDIAREIEILTATAHYNFEFEVLAEKCIELAKYADAERWIEKAEQADKSQFGERSRFLPVRIKLDVARKEFASALEKQWQYYIARPDEARYKNLLALHLENKLSERDCAQKVEAHLRSIADQPSKISRPTNGPLIDFYIYQKDYKKAVEIVQNNPADAYQIINLGLLIAHESPASAIDFHRRAAIRIAGVANNNVYRESVDILSKLKLALEATALPAFYTMVDALRQVDELKRKPNFIKELDRQFPPQ